MRPMQTAKLTGVTIARRLALLMTSCLLLLVVVLAARAHAIARGYTSADSGLKIGMVAALASEQANESQVERATQENIRRIVGVVTSVDDSLVTVASSSAKVLVETEGEMSAYVTDLGGEVVKGSLLAISPIKGVLMKVDSDSGSSVVAVASEGIANKTEAISYEVDDDAAKDTGGKKSVKITKVTVNLNRAGGGNSGDKADSSLARLGRAIVGKEVSEIRVIVALLLFLIVLIAEGAIMYGAISSAITALGRNPLARSAIRKEMLRILLVAFAVFLVGLGAIYGILWV